MMGVPMRLLLAAAWQWLLLSVLLVGGVLLTYFPCGLLVALTARPATNAFGQRQGTHEVEYIAAGSSAWWEYWATPRRWLSAWNNYEDGTLGEPSGKHSARVRGQERSIWNQYLWLCRNPFNQGKRTSLLLACPVNDCDLQWWGYRRLSDKAPVFAGWYFCCATHRTTGRRYFGFRWVQALPGGLVRQLNIGFKLKPEHACRLQDPDDADKAFTLRYQHASAAD